MAHTQTIHTPPRRDTGDVRGDGATISCPVSRLLVTATVAGHLCFHAGYTPSTTSRWPRLAAAVADREVYRSVHALSLRLRGEAIGALNLFHRQPGALPAADLALGQALADVADRDPVRTRRPTR